MWAILILLGIAVTGGLVLWIAIKQNGHAVLDTIDRLAGPVTAVERVHQASTGSDEKQKVIVYRANDTQTPLPVLIFFHGGSWTGGDPAHYGFIARNLAAEGFLVVLGGYRLGEQGRYPAMLEDTAAAVGWVHANIARFGGDPNRIFLAGHSAGAYNVVQTALEPRWLREKEVPEDAIRGVIGLAGPYDFHPFDKPSTKAAFGSVGAGAKSQPINHVRGDSPAVMLVHGVNDTVVRPRNTRALATALERAGASIETLLLPDGSHNDPLLALANPWRRNPLVRDHMLEFLRRHDKVSVPVQAKTP